MIVTFYRFTKKLNSTAIPPTEGGTSLELRLKTPCTMERPELEISAEGAADILTCNYAYIPAFQRRYFITGREFAGPTVIFALAVDELGTYDAEIKSSQQYVLRSASRSNGDIIDNMYPSKVTRQYDVHVQSTPWSVDFSNGRYVIGILTNGAAQYYLFTANDATAFFNILLSDAYLSAVLNDMQIAVSDLKLAVDPLQYIASCTWIPFIPAVGGTAVTSIKVGYTNVQASATLITSPLASYILSFSELPAHPLAAARGAYLNAAPFTRAALALPGFGQVELDPADIGGSTNALNISIWVDVRTGTATAEIYGKKLISKLHSFVGVPIQLSQVLAAGLGISTFTNIIGSVFGGGAGGLANGNLAQLVTGGVTGAVSALGDAMRSLIPSVTSVGSTGGLDSLGSAFNLTYTYMIPVDDAPVQLGRPLCEYVQLSTLSGYCLCSADSDIAIQRATPNEIDAILSAMRGGFYLE